MTWLDTYHLSYLEPACRILRPGEALSVGPADPDELVVGGVLRAEPYNATSTRTWKTFELLPAQYTMCDVLRLALGQPELCWLSEFVDVESAGRSGLAPLQPSFPTVDDAVFLCDGTLGREDPHSARQDRTGARR